IEARQLLLAADAHRLLDQRHIRFEQLWEDTTQRDNVVRLIGVNAYPSVRSRSSHSPQPCDIVLSSKLQFEAADALEGGRRARHCLGGVCADRISRQKRLGSIEPRNPP